jgi:hypothetical protein
MQRHGCIQKLGHRDDVPITSCAVQALTCSYRGSQPSEQERKGLSELKAWAEAHMHDADGTAMSVAEECKRQLATMAEQQQQQQGEVQVTTLSPRHEVAWVSYRDARMQSAPQLHSFEQWLQDAQGITVRTAFQVLLYVCEVQACHE